MTEKYTAETLAKMSEKELLDEKSFLTKMLVIWSYLAEPLPETIRGYHELGNERLTLVFLGRYKRLRRTIRCAERVLGSLDEELHKREAP